MGGANDDDGDDDDANSQRLQMPATVAWADFSTTRRLRMLVLMPTTAKIALMGSALCKRHLVRRSVSLREPSKTYRSRGGECGALIASGRRR